MKDSVVVEKILRTLADQYTYVVVSIEESHNIEEMDMDELQSTLQLHEQKFNRSSQIDSDQVLQVEDRYNAEKIFRGRGNFRGKGRGRGRLHPFNKSTVEWYKCHNLGHFQYECPKWNKEANYVAKLDEEDELVLMAAVGDEEFTLKKWYIDFG
ncbi:hypothetical protein LIER_10957 [Lithospermum erythrorhizon]|uniref:Polyprotein n=1 Tax=Lithospermum erythrorhizon TaxID=34254 RepID=A0AAV3PLD5_LITER